MLPTGNVSLAKIPMEVKLKNESQNSSSAAVFTSGKINFNPKVRDIFFLI